MSQKSLQNYIPALTGVRALAAYLVFVSHFGYVFDEYFPHSVQRFFREFHIGVTIFFVLSGFLIAFRYYDNFSLNKDWFKKYLKNRVARIYPMYAILTLGAFVYYFFSHDQSIVAGTGHPVLMFLMNITFIRGFFDQLKFTGIAQGWSLTVEECFYFSAPFMFYFAKKYGKPYLQPFMITGFGFLLVLMFRNLNWYGFFGNFTFLMLFTFLGRCFEFFTGIMLALYIRKNGLANNHKFKFTYLGFVLIFVCVWIMSVLPVLPGLAFGQQHPLGIITNNYLLAISIAIFFYGLITEDGTVLKRILSNKFVELLGKSSYIFYLIHLGYVYNMLNFSVNWLNDAVFKLYDQWGVDWVSPFQNEQLNLLYLFVVLNGIAIILFKNIEEPVNHYIRKSDFLVKNKSHHPENATAIKVD
ncbi:acyltransferase family protein [Mucilaginibacter paludis]|uniref:Acyltransferase 3 n=1 Tax=Mucilaginibacter paludis DSM 18603 TaxID=714943 RepID=H1Y702_9SPHI|nr:acyltransferase [Mucilaginibacter paludis]EHQ28409.1 acyltransferase 3 [Mucilaginibacter paludis DSM 18603]